MDLRWLAGGLATGTRGRSDEWGRNRTPVGRGPRRRRAAGEVAGDGGEGGGSGRNGRRGETGDEVVARGVCLSWRSVCLTGGARGAWGYHVIPKPVGSLSGGPRIKREMTSLPSGGGLGHVGHWVPHVCEKKGGWSWISASASVSAVCALRVVAAAGDTRAVVGLGMWAREGVFGYVEVSRWFCLVSAVLLCGR